MTVLMSCQSLSKSYGAKPLFENITVGISTEERLGLIGPNGAGKSTLLKVLAGEEPADDGQRSLKGSLRLVYLAQKDLLEDHKTIEQTLLDALAKDAVEDSEAYSRTQRIIGKTEFTDPQQLVSTLSGGWRKRLSIACAVVREPDLLLMDEPTNHLDLDGILWLESLLQNAPFAFLLVTHDRYFLENTTNRIIELSRRYPEGYLRIEGNYSEFLRQRESFLQGQAQKEAILSNKMRREIEWLRRGPKARTSKAQYRIDDAHRIMAEHAEVKARNAETQSVRIDFNATQRKTKKLLETHDVSKSLGGKPLFSQVSLRLSPGTRLGLLGRNGTGKSTFMRLLEGHLKPDSGFIERADQIQIVNFDQNREQLNLDVSLRKALSPEADRVVYRGDSIHIVSWAKRFLFRPEQLDLPVRELSGGEQARILIARLMLRPADILLLDEPTNDLDIPSLEVLEESLQDFPGALVLVTHDRFLLDRVATEVLGLDGRGNATVFADYHQWIESLPPKPTKSKSSDKTKTKAPQKNRPRKLSYKENKELEKMEENILEAESSVEHWQAQLQEPDVMQDSTKLQDACRELQVAQDRVEWLYQRWEELEAIQQGRL